MLSAIDKELIKMFQGDMILTEEPFKAAAEKLGMSEEQVIDKLKDFQKEGILKRIGVVLYHRAAGFNANAMVVWKVEKEKVDEIGNFLASIAEITHCYERETSKEWKYNLFTMIHGENRYDCEDLIRYLSSRIAIKDYKILYSTKELKKSSMKYYEL